LNTSRNWPGRICERTRRGETSDPSSSGCRGALHRTPDGGPATTGKGGKQPSGQVGLLSRTHDGLNKGATSNEARNLATACIVSPCVGVRRGTLGSVALPILAVKATGGISRTWSATPGTQRAKAPIRPPLRLGACSPRCGSFGSGRRIAHFRAPTRRNRLHLPSERWITLARSEACRPVIHGA